jgi:hypothetical protein
LNLLQVSSPTGYKIWGATYGPVDVTYNVQTKYANGKSTFTGNADFGDTWAGVVKNFVLLYSQGDTLTIQVA